MENPAPQNPNMITSVDVPKSADQVPVPATPASEMITSVPGIAVTPEATPTTTQPEITGVPSNLGGQEVHAAVEASQAAAEQRVADLNKTRADHLKSLGLEPTPNNAPK